MMAESLLLRQVSPKFSARPLVRIQSPRFVKLGFWFKNEVSGQFLGRFFSDNYDLLVPSGTPASGRYGFCVYCECTLSCKIGNSDWGEGGF